MNDQDVKNKMNANYEGNMLINVSRVINNVLQSRHHTFILQNVKLFTRT